MIGCSVRSHFLLAITNNFFPSIIDLLNADMNRVMPLRSMDLYKSDKFVLGLRSSLSF
jgi:hypothetical protein